MNYFDNMNDLLNKHAPLKKISKYNLKFKTKPWITAALRRSISIKNALFKRHIKLKSPLKKNILHQQYIYYGNPLSTLIKKANKIIISNFLKTTCTILKIYRKA